MGILLVTLVVLAISGAIGFGLAAAFFKAESGRMAGGTVLSLPCLGVNAAVGWAGCGQMLRGH